MSVDRRLIVGLGNPGEKYRYTRHNIAWLILDAFADRVKWRGGGKERDAAILRLGKMAECGERMDFTTTCNCTARLYTCATSRIQV